ncbi:MAG: rhodanese-like domain-containing protein [Peptococcaceae bacterium]
MQRIFLMVILLGALILNIGCQSKEQSPGYQNIEPKIAYEKLQKEKDIVLLDVRTPEEYHEKHIPGSILIPLDLLKEQAEQQIKDKDGVIFVYCRSGNRSAKAAELLANLGYTKVYNLGGINNWPYETESGPETGQTAFRVKLKTQLLATYRPPLSAKPQSALLMNFL